MIIFETGFCNFTVFYRFTDGATWVGIMLAVAIFAMAQVVMKFDKSVGDLFRFEMPEAKFAYPRGVNHIAAVREVIQARGGRGVLPQTGVIRHIIGEDRFL